jgi:hypothetical protein
LQPVATTRSTAMCVDPRRTGRHSTHASSAINEFATHTQLNSVPHVVCLGFICVQWGSFIIYIKTVCEMCSVQEKQNNNDENFVSFIFDQDTHDLFYLFLDYNYYYYF